MHQVTLQFPKQETYELGSQLRRAATSIPLNIAEGYGRKDSVAEFKQFLLIAQGSTNEVKVLLEMIKDLGYMESTKFEEMYDRYDHLAKQLYRLIESWK